MRAVLPAWERAGLWREAAYKATSPQAVGKGRKELCEELSLCFISSWSETL